jgi:CIC family chloride channel protein
MNNEEKDRTKIQERTKESLTEHSDSIIKFFKILVLSAFFGAICGIVMVLFKLLLLFFKFTFSFLPYYISPLIAGGLTSLIVKVNKKRDFTPIMGSGAPRFIEEVTGEGKDYDKVSILIGKTFATSWTFGSGMACGKEGPGLLIGANLGHIFSKKFRFSDLGRLDFYFVGASACTSAILKAPISGSLFCAELPYSNHIKYRSLLASIFASAISYIIFCSVFEFEPLIPSYFSQFEFINYFTLLILTLLFGIFIGLFILLLITILRSVIDKTSKFSKKKSLYWILPFIGAILYSVLILFIMFFIDPKQHNIFIGPDTSSLSFLIHNIQKMNWSTLLLLSLLFIIAMSCSIGFSNSAGLILPLMLYGALIGGLFGVLVYPDHPELFILLGISAALGAALNNPITAIILIVEMTWDPFLFIPAAITTIVCHICSGPKTIVPVKERVKPTVEL